jgi:DNA-binding transcriptional LysR family regulator
MPEVYLLRTLVAVDQHGSFACAADHIGRSPSAVSLKLKRLWLLIGSPLFHRARRGMAFTEAGQTVLGYAAPIWMALVRPHGDNRVRTHVILTTAAPRFLQIPPYRRPWCLDLTLRISA